MKYLKLILALTFIVSLQSCNDDDNTSSSETTEETSSSSDKTKTEVVLTLKTSDGVTKSNYTVMAFDKEFKPQNTFSPSDAVITKTSDSNGKVTFDFEDKASKAYYFEAFTMKSNGNYVLKSKYRSKFDVKKGSKLTSEIIVD